jgi:hypothetical protein
MDLFYIDCIFFRLYVRPKFFKEDPCMFHKKGKFYRYVVCTVALQCTLPYINRAFPVPGLH